MPLLATCSICLLLLCHITQGHCLAPLLVIHIKHEPSQFSDGCSVSPVSLLESHLTASEMSTDASVVPHGLNIPVKHSSIFIRFLVLIVLCVYVVYVQFNNSESIVALNNERSVFNSSLCACNKQMFGSHSKPNDTEFYWCSEESFARGYNQKVVTYVLFGNASNSTTFNRYYALLENISIAVEEEYPGFTVRIYHNLDDEEDQGGFHSLCKIFCRFSHVDLCSVNTLHKHLVERSERCSRALGKQMPIEPALIKGLNPKMYRYLIMLDPQVDIFVSRDVDSIIWPREVYAVREWIESNFTFHLMRDHTAHTAIILAGIFVKFPIGTP